MRAVVQRVTEAAVTVEDREVGSIGTGVVALVGIHSEDTAKDVEYIADKLVNLRIFRDEAGVMNRSLIDVGGSALIVSQFTLYGDARRGRRPSYIEAASGETAQRLYEAVCRRVEELGVPVQTGVFGAMMCVHLVNDGPVTILLDSRRIF
ncbi:MAG: D-aminoacyl-tRNA deacylase [Chthonomonadales bacterium]